MKNNIRLLGIIAATLAVGLFIISCATAPANLKASSPANIKIDVTGRTMTVTWDEVKNADGYEIITDSENCGSGKRKINTKNNTAIVYNTANTPPEGANALKDDASNGAVVILAKNKIQITLMPAMGDPSKPMATAVTAKVMAFGGTVEGKKYLDSDYSSVVRKELGGGM